MGVTAWFGGTARAGWSAPRLPDVRRVLGAVAPPCALVAVQLVWFGLPVGAWLRGLTIGLLTALLAVGMALVYRANRVLNFAQADLGFVPASLAVGLIVFSGLPYLLGLGVGLASSIVLGAAVEFFVVRRFIRSSRLVLTVATIGITQLLAVLAVLTPRMWDQRAASQRIPAPVDWKLTVGTFILTANDLIAMVVAPVAMVAVAVFLGRTRIGAAVRGAAERRDRAALLGLPVTRLSTLVWSLAAALSFVALFLRAGILGVPIGSALSLTTLTFALAALVIGRLHHLPTIALTGVALGVLEYGVAWNAESPLLVTPIVGAAVLVALLTQRRRHTRADLDETASWQLSDEARPLDPHTARLPAVRVARGVLVLLVVAGLVAIPLVLRVDQVVKASAVAAFAIVGLSLVVLTGWAGQVSLGQMGFVAIGAAVAGRCTASWDVDLTLALLVGGAAGATAAGVVGLPALRLRGLHLAVTTLVFAFAVSSWLLNDRFFDWVPRRRLERPPLFGRIDVDSPGRYYAYSVVVLALVLAALSGVRNSRTGRAIRALASNERAAQSYAIAPVRLKLTAFMLSGGVAGLGGGLYVHLVQSFDLASYGVGASLDVFTATVVGGLGSLAGGVLGATYLRGTRWFVTDPAWQFLSSAVGVLIVLLVLPGGLTSLAERTRDRFVAIARRRRAT